MSGLPSRKFVREVMQKCGADSVVKIRSKKHCVVEFRRKGADHGVVYTLPASPSCFRAAINAAHDIRRGLDAIDAAVIH